MSLAKAMKYPVTPKPYHRMTQHSKHTAAAKKYHDWMNDLQKLRLEIPDAGASIIFRMPMPKSWSKKKKADMHGTAHQQKPDLDNLIKALMDAARVRSGDHTVWHLGGAMKVWWHEGEIEVLTPNG